MVAFIAVDFDDQIRSSYCLDAHLPFVGHEDVPYDHPCIMGRILLDYYNHPMSSFGLVKKGTCFRLEPGLSDSEFKESNGPGTMRVYPDLPSLMTPAYSGEWSWLYVYITEHKQWYFCQAGMDVLLELTPSLVNGPSVVVDILF